VRVLFVFGDIVMSIRRMILVGSLAAANIVGADATPSVTGAFVSIFGGGKYTEGKLFVRGQGQERKDQVTIFEGNRFCGDIGLNVGYGYASVGGVFFGGKIFAKASFPEIKLPSDVKSTNKDLIIGDNQTKTSFSVRPYRMELKPWLSFGGGVQLGFLATPNLVVGVGVAGAGDYTTGSMDIVFRNTDSAVLNDGMILSVGSSGDIQIEDSVKATPTKVDKITATSLAVIPSVFVRFYTASGFFVGFEAFASVGLNSKVDAKYYSNESKIVRSDPAAEYTLKSLKANGLDLYLRSNHYGAGIELGYRF
jgi:hypothetical protein